MMKRFSLALHARSVAIGISMNSWVMVLDTLIMTIGMVIIAKGK